MDYQNIQNTKNSFFNFQLRNSRQKPHQCFREKTYEKCLDFSTKQKIQDLEINVNFLHKYQKSSVFRAQNKINIVVILNFSQEKILEAFLHNINALTHNKFSNNQQNIPESKRINSYLVFNQILILFQQVTLKLDKDQMSFRQSWTKNEDNYLRNLVFSTQKVDWNEIAQLMNTEFCQRKRQGKQCRERFINYSKFSESNSQISAWTAQEMNILFSQFEKYGGSWSLISQSLPGRSENSIKNKFYGNLRKFVRSINRIMAQQPGKKKKKIRYQSVVRVIDAAECFQTMGDSLKDTSLILRHQVFSLIWKSSDELTFQQIFDFGQNINEFNLKTRSFRSKKPKNTTLIPSRDFSQNNLVLNTNKNEKYGADNFMKLIQDDQNHHDLPFDQQLLEQINRKPSQLVQFTFPVIPELKQHQSDIDKVDLLMSFDNNFSNESFNMYGEEDIFG